MIGKQQRWQEELFVAGPLSSLIPQDHILKLVDEVLEELKVSGGLLKKSHRDA